ncbi:hypothetical protein FACS18948_2420 [Clostridia bacterium]|nr:hypothetical protein FACS18948_2420 [Clostridia bacterium]
MLVQKVDTDALRVKLLTWILVAALYILMIITGASWYIARAGVVGIKDWNFVDYGRSSMTLIAMWIIARHPASEARDIRPEVRVTSGQRAA